jgi:hypothetical protein
MTGGTTVTITLTLDQLRDVVRQEVERALQLRPASVAYSLGTSGKMGVDVKEYDTDVIRANEKAAAIFHQAVVDLRAMGTTASRWHRSDMPEQLREERS